jgi:hypothetical protein
MAAYSPELNPDEYLNNDLKNAVHGNKGSVSRNKETIRKKIVSHLRHLQKSPGKVAKLFNHPKVLYAKTS